MRKTEIKHRVLDDTLKHQLLLWASQFDEVIWLDSNHHSGALSSYKAILAVDGLTSLKTSFEGAFDALDAYQEACKDWLFGYLTYDLKNDLEDLDSSNFDGLHFPDLFFFQPKRLFLFHEDHIEVSYLNMIDDEIASDWEAIQNISLNRNSEKTEVRIRLRTSKDSYYRKVEEMIDHIKRGDIYEANFCQEFYSECVHTFTHLNAISRPPFATYLKLKDHYLLSASPERYLAKQGEKVVSQPIKGTAKRGSNPRMDAAIAARLKADPKERSENIMITDLVRNDLSRFAIKGSVTVEELCALHTFDQVHQLVSTVSCKVPESLSPITIIRDTFPMGSMTGAPKISAMKIIEELEDTKRGLYSGAVGYISPEKDMDFNVIIRSILYNATTRYVSFSVGGAITARSTPEREYEECLVKAKAMREVLE